MVPKVLYMVGSSGEELVGTSLSLGTGCHCHHASHKPKPLGCSTT